MIALIGQRGGCGGLLAVNAAGELSMPFNGRGLYRGSIDASGQARTSIYRDRALVRELAAA